MTEERIANYNDHAMFMADIAINILNGKKGVLDVNGVKEIIALYLLIPYITPDKLTTPNEKCVIPNISGDFCNGISLENLRNAICHSFVTVEEDKKMMVLFMASVLLLMTERCFITEKPTLIWERIQLLQI